MMNGTNGSVSQHKQQNYVVANETGIFEQQQQQKLQQHGPFFSSSTLVHLLMQKALVMPEHQLLTWVDKDCNETQKWTYKELNDASDSVASLLRRKGCKNGDRVMVAYPFCLDFLAGMFGAMKIGVIPCSIYPPNPKKMKTEMAKFKRFAQDADAKFALTTETFATIMTAASLVYQSGVRWIGTNKLSPTRATMTHDELEILDSEQIAFIQYTSGSTGRPKGVMISHRSLLNNCREIATIGEADPSHTGVLWVPQYHDMGLVGGFMTTIYSGVHLIAASPLDFIQNPLIWADLVEKYQADYTCAPNFAFGLLMKRLDQANRTADWTNVKRAILGGEPTRIDIVNKLVTDMKMKPENVWNMYGMAECALCITAGAARVGRSASTSNLVSCGSIDTPYARIRIVRDGKIVEDGEEGSIWVQSSLVASGYFGQKALTESAFSNEVSGSFGKWLDTGDLGKTVDCQLFVTARTKDVIIINGKNYYPTDIEECIESAYSNKIRIGRTAAFQVSDTTIGVTVEMRSEKDNSDASKELIGHILGHISQEVGLVTEKVIMLKTGSTPKTTSGKLKRSEIQRRSIEGDWTNKQIVFSWTPRQSVGSASGSNFTSPQIKIANKEGDGVASAVLSVESTFKDVLGPALDFSLDWEANGLTSMLHSELISRVQEFHHVSLSVDFNSVFPTPGLLKNWIESADVSQAFPSESRNHGELHPNQGKLLPWYGLGILQAFGVVVLLFAFTLSLLSAFFVGKQVAKYSVAFEVGSTARWVVWSWIPVVVPTFFVSLSLLAILAKWIVIGRYRRTMIELGSWAYLRWWFVDRLMDIWERWVGSFITNTAFIWLFYCLMGANLNWSCSVDAFIREFDLVRVGKESVISHQLRCRKFTPRNNDGSRPSLIFRPIAVGANANIAGMLGPGVTVGDGSRVETLSAVSEGCQIPSRVVAKGAPAYNAGPHVAVSPLRHRWLLESIKVALLVVEMYHFFALFLLSQVALNQQLPPQWRYTPLLYWVLIILLMSAVAVVSSIGLKWTLIGRRYPGNDNSGLLRQACFWFCDYHFQLAVMTLMPLLGVSRIWNVVLFMHGLDIDLISMPANILTFLPSKVDLIRIKRSFISTATIDASEEVVEICDSNIGYNSHIRTGVTIRRSVVPPRVTVDDSVHDSSFGAQPGIPSVKKIIASEFAMLVSAVLVFLSFVASYEVFVATVSNSPTVFTSPVWLCVVVVVQCISWIFLDRFLQMLLFSSNSAMRSILYPAYLNTAWLHQHWNVLLVLLQGTSFIRVWLRFMGAQVSADTKELWYFGSIIYDFPMISFEGNTILDDVHVSGHFVVFDSLTIATTHLNGLIHPGSYAPGGAYLQGSEFGPWKVGPSQQIKQDDIISKESDYVSSYGSEYSA